MIRHHVVSLFGALWLLGPAAQAQSDVKPLLTGKERWRYGLAARECPRNLLSKDTLAVAGHVLYFQEQPDLAASGWIGGPYVLQAIDLNSREIL